MESEVKIYQTVRGDKSYNNIDIKKGSLDNDVAPLGKDKYIVVKKLKEEGFKVENRYNTEFPNYVVTVEYKGTEVSFFMNSGEYHLFQQKGSVGDKVRLWHRRQVTKAGKAYSVIETTLNED